MLAQLWLATTLTTTTLSACGHHDYPPWNWLSDGKIIGVCAEVVSTLYQRLGFNVDLDYVGPWARCQQKVAKEGANKSPNIKMRPCKHLNLIN